MGGRCHDHSVKAEGEELAVVAHRLAAEKIGDPLGLRLIGIRNRNQFRAWELGQHAGVIRSHDADARDADAYRTVRGALLIGRCRMSHFSPLLPFNDCAL